MDGDAGYALQKLELSINDLAIGAGDIRSRLRHVFMEHLHVINERDFPNELKNDWVSICKALKKKARLKMKKEKYLQAQFNVL